MDTRQYKIIWADDQINGIVSPREEKYLAEKKSVFLLAKPKTGVELREAMRENLDKVDAVIVDANFDANESIPESERIISGLRIAFELYQRYNVEGNKGIPFYLFTQRKKSGLSCESADLKLLKEIFEDTHRWFEKADGYDRMINKIIKDVNNINTPEYKLRQKYSNEFAAADNIPGASELLFKCLLNENANKDDYKDAKLYFNPMRMIWEKIESECKLRGLLPQISKLNSMADFLMGKEDVEGFTLTREIMPKALAQSLRFFLNITQDGSHQKEDLTLKVIEYIQSTKSSNLFRAILYIALDLLLWYNDYSQNITDEIPWKVNYILQEEVKSRLGNNGKPQFYIDHYLLLPHEGEVLHEGDIVGVADITSAIDNRYPFLANEKTIDKALRKYKIIGINAQTPNVDNDSLEEAGNVKQ